MSTPQAPDTERCRIPAAGAPPGCGAGPFARYLWFVRSLFALARRLLRPR